MRTSWKLGLLGMALMVASAIDWPAKAQPGTGLYWQCVAPSAASPTGGYCPVNSTTPLPVNAGSITASLAGFTPNGSVANLSVTTASANVALPTGTVVALANTGATDASVKLSVGASTAATSDFVLKAGATVGLTVGSNTYLNAITASGSTTLSLAGGSGLVSGYGGSSSAAASNASVGTNGSAVKTSSTLAGVSDGTNQQQVVAPIALGDGVNGNNSISAGGYVWNGTSWDRMPGTTTGVKVTVVNNGVAQGSTTSGQTPSPIGGRTLSTTPTDTTTQTNIPVLSVNGALLTAPYALPDRLVQGTTAAMTGTTPTQLLAAPGANLFNYVTSISCVNSHATNGTLVTVQDGSGGTTLMTLAAASLFGGTVMTFPAPFKQPTANTALYVVDVTTSANVLCNASGYKGP